MTVDAGPRAPEEPAEAVTPAVVARFLHHLDQADDAAAVQLVRDLLAAGTPAADILVDLIAVAQREVGERWRTGRWSVAREHAATHISERAVGVVAESISPGPSRGRLVLACVEGEWHALAARLVAEALRAAGWRVTFLGASVPPRHLVSYLHQTGPYAVLLSCVQPARLVRAARMVEACRLAGAPVLAGGPGFGPHGRWAGPVGAAAWGATARDAADLLAHRRFGPETTGPLRRTSGEEHVVVLRRRAELVDRAVRAVGPYPGDPDALAAGVSQLVDGLAGGLLVDDPDLLADHVAWQRGVLTARDRTADPLDTVLTSCATLLADHPRAARHLGYARRAWGAAR